MLITMLITNLVIKHINHYYYVYGFIKTTYSLAGKQV